MDFEEFRKNRDAIKQKKADKEAERERRANAPAANGKNLDWIDGMGPAGPRNPKVKGFVLGRFTKKRIDPNTLQRPANFEPTSAPHEVDPLEAEMERRRLALEKAEAELEALEQKKREAEIEQRRREQGIGRVRGLRRY